MQSLVDDGKLMERQKNEILDKYEADLRQIQMKQNQRKSIFISGEILLNLNKICISISVTIGCKSHSLGAIAITIIFASQSQ